MESKSSLEFKEQIEDEEEDITINVSEEDFKHLEEDVNSGLKVIITFEAPDENTATLISNTLHKYEWIIPYHHGSSENQDKSILEVTYDEGDENTEERLKIFSKYIPNTKITLNTIMRDTIHIVS